MDGQKSFFGTPKKALIFITCAAAIISVFVIGTVFVITCMVKSPRSGNVSIAKAGESQEAENGESRKAEIVESRESESGYAEPDREEPVGEGAEADADMDMDEVKSIAASHAGFSVSEVVFSKAKLEKEHRQMVYELEFYKDGMEYEYEIDANTGDIIEYSSEWDD